MFRISLVAVALAAVLSAPAAAMAGTVTIDFEQFKSGNDNNNFVVEMDLVTDQSGSFTFDFDATGGKGLVNPVAFDSSIGAQGLQDNDLLAPFDGGNAMNADLGIVAIIQETDGRNNNDDQPNDARSGGTISATTQDASFISFEATIIDQEIAEFNRSGFAITLFDDMGGSQEFDLSFFTSSQPDLVFDCNFANTFIIGDNDLTEIDSFVGFEVDFPGSGALGDICLTLEPGTTPAPVPAPAMLVLLVSGIIGLATLRKRS